MVKTYTEAEVIRYMDEAAEAAIQGYKHGCKKGIIQCLVCGVVMAGITTCAIKIKQRKSKAQSDEHHDDKESKTES